MTAWQCGLCSHRYHEGEESIRWDDLSAEWGAPICNIPGSKFMEIV